MEFLPQLLHALISLVVLLSLEDQLLESMLSLRVFAVSVWRFCSWSPPLSPTP